MIQRESGKVSSSRRVTNLLSSLNLTFTGFTCQTAEVKHSDTKSVKKGIIFGYCVLSPAPTTLRPVGGHPWRVQGWQPTAPQVVITTY
jgi:hypothetical protein